MWNLFFFWASCGSLLAFWGRVGVCVETKEACCRTMTLFPLACALCYSLFRMALARRPNDPILLFGYGMLLQVRASACDLHTKRGVEKESERVHPSPSPRHLRGTL